MYGYFAPNLLSLSLPGGTPAIFHYWEQASSPSGFWSPTVPLFSTGTCFEIGGIVPIAVPIFPSFGVEHLALVPAIVVVLCWLSSGFGVDRSARFAHFLPISPRISLELTSPGPFCCLHRCVRNDGSHLTREDHRSC